MEKKNQDIREKLKDNGVPMWKVGELLGVSEMTIIRWFRTPLSDSKREAVLNAIDRLCGGKYE